MLVPLGLWLIIALLACACCGLGNAVMVNYLKFPTFIATLAMASISQGIAYLVSGGLNLDINDKVLNFIGTERLGGFLPYSFILSMLALVIYAIILNKTKFGRSICLVGGNPEASRLAGLKPKKVSFILFVNASAMACIGGTIMSARIKTATCSGLSGSQFTGITAAILGGISFGGGNGGMMGALIGIMILNVFNNGMQLIGLTSYYQTVASGLLLILALCYDRAMEIGKMKRALK
ncbi:MAG: ABC transporter permease [Oscillospiraceae bacterium]|nr:ABC transporter permease [Oscillospiraceae bacterium]